MSDDQPAKRRFPLLMIAPPLVFLALAFMFFLGMYRSDDPMALPSTREGGPVPELTLSELSGGGPFGAEELNAPGVKLVNFWASWCTPCRVEHPQLEMLAREGVTIYGVNYKDDPTRALMFLDEMGNPYAALGADDQGRTGLDWGIYGVPETFIIDGNGIVVKRFAGPITMDTLENVIRPAIAEAEAR